MTHGEAIIEENGRTYTEVFACVGSQAEQNEYMIDARKKIRFNYRHHGHTIFKSASEGN